MYRVVAATKELLRVKLAKVLGETLEMRQKLNAAKHIRRAQHD